MPDIVYILVLFNFCFTHSWNKSNLFQKRWGWVYYCLTGDKIFSSGKRIIYFTSSLANSYYSSYEFLLFCYFLPIWFASYKPFTLNICAFGIISWKSPWINNGAVPGMSSVSETAILSSVLHSNSMFWRHLENMFLFLLFSSNWDSN